MGILFGISVLGYWCYVSRLVLCFMLLLLSYTILSQSNIHSIRVGTWIRSFIFPIPNIQNWPRTFYRSGWLRCDVFNSWVYLLSGCIRCQVWRCLTLGVTITIIIHIHIHTYIIYYYIYIILLYYYILYTILFFPSDLCSFPLLFLLSFSSLFHSSVKGIHLSKREYTSGLYSTIHSIRVDVYISIYLLILSQSNIQFSRFNLKGLNINPLLGGKGIWSSGFISFSVNIQCSVYIK